MGPPLNGRSSHLIEAAKRGRLDQMIFFSAPLTTRAPPTTVWPPRSNAADDRLGGGLGGLCPPSQKPGGLGGSAPQPKSKTKKNFFFIFRKVGLEKSVSADGEFVRSLTFNRTIHRRFDSAFYQMFDQWLIFRYMSILLDKQRVISHFLS